MRDTEKYEALKESYKKILKEVEEELKSNTPSCFKCIYGDECPVYWRCRNAACLTIFKNRFI